MERVRVRCREREREPRMCVLFWFIFFMFSWPRFAICVCQFKAFSLQHFRSFAFCIHIFAYLGANKIRMKSNAKHGRLPLHFREWNDFFHFYETKINLGFSSRNRWDTSTCSLSFLAFSIKSHTRPNVARESFCFIIQPSFILWR